MFLPNVISIMFGIKGGILKMDLSKVGIQTEKKVVYPWFVKEDIDGFFALFQNNLNFVVIAISLIGMGYPSNIVYGKIIPGAAISVLFGNFYYAHMAKNLRKKSFRCTALSYGISTPVMFIYLFGIMA